MANRNFGYSNAGMGFRSPNGFPTNQNHGYNNQPQFPEYEQDTDREVQAYLKIGFTTNSGTKFLNFGRTDKQLRDSSPLERMILEHWRDGGDVNELLEAMVLEIHDANPDNSDLAFVPRNGVDTTPKPKRKRAAPAKATQASDDDEE